MFRNRLFSGLCVIAITGIFPAYDIHAEELPATTAEEVAEVPIEHRVDGEIAILRGPKAPAEEKVDACQRLLAVGGRAWPATDALIDLLDDPKFKPAAEQLLRQIGPVAAQALGRRIAALDSRWLELTDVLASIPRGANAAVPPLCEVLVEGRATQKVAALRALRAIGDASRSAWPEIRASLEDKELGVRWGALKAAEAALSLDGEGTQLVLELGNARDRDQCVRSIRQFPNPAHLIPALIYESHSSNREVATCARQLWTEMSIHPAVAQWAAPPGYSQIRVEWPVTKQLAENVIDGIRLGINSPPHSEMILQRLGNGELPLAPYIPFIIEAMQNGTPEVKEATLSKALEIAPEVVPLLKEATRSADPQLRVNAVHAIALLAAKNQLAAKTLIELIDSRRIDVRVVAIQETGKSGSVAQPGIRRLISLAASESEVAGSAIAALAELGNTLRTDDAILKPAVAMLTHRALSPDDTFRTAATLAWARVAPASDDRQLSALMAQWNSKDPAVHTLASEALFSLPRTAQLVPTMVAMLDDSDNDLRLRAVEVLAAMGPDARPAAGRLSRMVDNQFAPLRQAAARALVRVNPTPQQLAAAYIAAARNGDIDAQATLTQPVRRSTESAERATSRLTELAKGDPDENVRAHAKAAIEALAQ